MSIIANRTPTPYDDSAIRFVSSRFFSHLAMSVVGAPDIALFPQGGNRGVATAPLRMCFPLAILVPQPP